MGKKCYKLMLGAYYSGVSKRYAGMPTGYGTKVEKGLKIHAIRLGYDRWQRQMDEIDKGNAYLSVGVWKDARNGGIWQREVARFGSTDGIGVEKLNIDLGVGIVINDRPMFPATALVVGRQLAINNGQTVKQLRESMRNAKLSEDYAIIHFTKFRYEESS